MEYRPSFASFSQSAGSLLKSISFATQREASALLLFVSSYTFSGDVSVASVFIGKGIEVL